MPDDFLKKLSKFGKISSIIEIIPGVTMTKNFIMSATFLLKTEEAFLTKTDSARQTKPKYLIKKKYNIAKIIA